MGTSSKVRTKSQVARQTLISKQTSKGKPSAGGVTIRHRAADTLSVERVMVSQSNKRLK